MTRLTTDTLGVARDDVRDAARAVDRLEADEATVTAAVLDVAKASSTLALAEEQRTANLIAMLTAVNPTGTPVLFSNYQRDWLAAHIVDRLDLEPILTAGGAL